MSRRLAGLAACALLGAACVPWPAPTKTPSPTVTVRPLPPSFMEELITRRSATGITMKAYNTGAIRTRGGAVSAMKSWSAKVKLDVPSFAVRHPNYGLLLFDVGLTTPTAKLLNSGALTGLVVTFESKPFQDVRSQLESDGTKPEDVKWIVLSHLHLDHMGDLAAFPNATVIVSRKEWEGQKKKAGRDPKEFDPAAWESRLRLRLIDLDGQPPYGAFDHGLDLFADGTVFLLDLGGHTAGSMGAWVNLDGGPVLLAGDASWVVDNYMDLSFPHKRGFQDIYAYRHSVDMIRAMQEAIPRLVVFPGHDLTPLTLSRRTDIPVSGR